MLSFSSCVCSMVLHMYASSFPCCVPHVHVSWTSSAVYLFVLSGTSTPPPHHFCTTGTPHHPHHPHTHTHMRTQICTHTPPHHLHTTPPHITPRRITSHHITLHYDIQTYMHMYMHSDLHANTHPTVFAWLPVVVLLRSIVAYMYICLHVYLYTSIRTIHRHSIHILMGCNQVRSSSNRRARHEFGMLAKPQNSSSM